MKIQNSLIGQQFDLLNCRLYKFKNNSESHDIEFSKLCTYGYFCNFDFMIFFFLEILCDEIMKKVKQKN